MAHNQQSSDRHTVHSFWQQYLCSVQRSMETPPCEVFHFGDSQQSASTLASLVLEGKKRATTSLLLEAESFDSLPKVGELAIVTDWDGKPLCIIETSSEVGEIIRSENGVRVAADAIEAKLSG